MYIRVPISTGGAFYIGFNRDADFNSGTQEGQDKVIINSKPGSEASYNLSNLEAKLGAGGSKLLDAGDRAVLVEVTSVGVAYATVVLTTMAPAPTPAPATAATSPAPTNCPQSLSTFEISLTTDNYPQETSWTLQDDTDNAEIASGNGYTQEATTFQYTYCLDGTHVYTFGDGICCKW